VLAALAALAAGGLAAAPANADDLAERLVAEFAFDRDWESWEVHPAGDEIVVLLSGAVDLVLEEPDGERIIALRERGTVIVPRGVWHTANVIAPSEVLHITRGEGTQHRPR
jgi:mannose-6-phosphate isomerase-like protein (cupin superfamily)